MQKNVGVIGLGIIGQRVADTLRRRGFHVFVWNRTPRPFPNFVGSPAELADLCDFIQIFVSDDTALLQMVQQMRQSLKSHHIIMAHSTVAPDTVREAAEIVHRRGAQLLDAPFTGSKEAAAKGEIVYYVAGDDAAYRRARPVLEASSKEIIEIGEIGQATTIKVATNMITAATVQAAAEALALVHAAGLPLEKFASAMRSNGSNSGTLTMKLPKMLSGDFEPHFSVKHMLKDVQIAVRLARAEGLRLGVTEVAREALIEVADRGGADQDYSAVMRTFFPDALPPAPPVEELRPEPVVESEEAVARQPETAPEKPTEREPAAPPEEPPPEPEIPQPKEPESIKVAEEPPAPAEPIASDAKEDVTEETEREEARVEPEIPDRREPEVPEEEEDEPPPEEEAEEIGNAFIETKPEPVTRVAAARIKEAETPEPRGGFLSRLFGRSTDY